MAHEGLLTRNDMSQITVQELFEAGVHFGHQTRRWNPKMKPYIFEERNGIHLINLNETVKQFEKAAEFLAAILRKGGTVLFVGTKKQAQTIVRETAESCGQPFVTERWLGGTLTNLNTIKRSLNRLRKIEQMEQDGTMNLYVKQEQASLRREKARLIKNLGGIRNMEALPQAAFIVDIKREHNAVAEIRKLRIPLVAIVDTNCDPDLVDYPIAGNDDAIRSVKFLLTNLGHVAVLAKAEYEAKYGRRGKTEGAEAAAVAEAPVAAPAVVGV